MTKQKSPLPAALPADKGAKTGSICEMTQLCIKDFTTVTVNRQMGFIANYLLHGAENAIPRRDLMALTGYSDRELRRLIEAERRQGVAILSDNQHGYFLPGNQEELDHCVRSLRSRAAEILKTAAAVEKAVLP